MPHRTHAPHASYTSYTSYRGKADAPDDLPRGAEPSARRRTGTRPHRRRLRRRRRSLRGLVQSHEGTAPTVRPGTDHRHAHQRGGHRRHGDGRRDGRPAARPRTDDRQLRLRRTRPDSQPPRPDALHVRRPSHAPRHHTHAGRRRTSTRRTAFAQPRADLRPHPRPQGRLSGDSRRREGAPQGQHPRSEPRHLPRTRGAV